MMVLPARPAVAEIHPAFPCGSVGECREGFVKKPDVRFDGEQARYQPAVADHRIAVAESNFPSRESHQPTISLARWMLSLVLTPLICRGRRCFRVPSCAATGRFRTPYPSCCDAVQSTVFIHIENVVALDKNLASGGLFRRRCSASGGFSNSQPMTISSSPW